MIAGLMRQALLLAAIAGVILLVACSPGDDEDDTKRKPDVDCKDRPELCT